LFPLFLLKETEAFVPHDREAQTQEQRPSSGFIKVREGHRERRQTAGKNEKKRQRTETKKKNRGIDRE
jgi:hypothetical protein